MRPQRAIPEAGFIQEAHMPDRKLIDTGTDRRPMRRDDQGRITEPDNVGRSLAGDRRHNAERAVRTVHGARGDR
jgi:hypothetical protein